jgi:hypothetical protein
MGRARRLGKSGNQTNMRGWLGRCRNTYGGRRHRITTACRITRKNYNQQLLRRRGKQTREA